MSEGPEIHQIELNYTAPSVSRQTPELNRLDYLLSLQRGNVWMVAANGRNLC